MRFVVVCIVLLTASPCVADVVHVPWSCRILAKLHGIDTPSTTSIDEAERGLADAMLRADANLTGVKFCLRAARHAIDKAKLK